MQCCEEVDHWSKVWTNLAREVQSQAPQRPASAQRTPVYKANLGRMIPHLNWGREKLLKYEREVDTNWSNLDALGNEPLAVRNAPHCGDLCGVRMPKDQIAHPDACRLARTLELTDKNNEYPGQLCKPRLECPHVMYKKRTHAVVSLLHVYASN